MRFLSTPTRRIVAMNFFSMLAFQATYFVGVIGCATYVLGLGALEVSALVFLLNVVLVAGNLASGPVIDSIGPRRTLMAVLSATSALGAVAWLAPVSYPELVLVAMALGLSFGMSTTAIDAYPRYFSEDAGELARMNSLNQVATGASVVFGPAMAGWITTWAPVQCVFSLLMLAPVPAVALAWATREELTAARRAAAGDGSDVEADVCPDGAVGAERPAGGLRGFLSNAAEGVRIVFGREDLRVLFFIGFLGFFLPTAPSTRSSRSSTETCSAWAPTGWAGSRPSRGSAALRARCSCSRSPSKASPRVCSPSSSRSSAWGR